MRLQSVVGTAAHGVTLCPGQGAPAAQPHNCVRAECELSASKALHSQEKESSIFMRKPQD